MRRQRNSPSPLIKSTEFCLYSNPAAQDSTNCHLSNFFSNSLVIYIKARLIHSSIHNPIPYFPNIYLPENGSQEIEARGTMPVADPCSSSSKSSTSPSKFSKVFRKLVPFISKNNSGKEELSCSSLSLPHSITIQQRSCELQRIFYYFAENGDNKISPSELQNCMRATGEELLLEEAEEAVRLSDSYGDGELGLEDFAKLVEVEDEHEKDRNLMDAFQMYEMDG